MPAMKRTLQRTLHQACVGLVTLATFTAAAASMAAQDARPAGGSNPPVESLLAAGPAALPQGLDAPAAPRLLAPRSATAPMWGVLAALLAVACGACAMRMLVRGTLSRTGLEDELIAALLALDAWGRGAAIRARAARRGVWAAWARFRDGSWAVRRKQACFALHRGLVAAAIAAVVTTGVPSAAWADDLYRNNTGANTTLDTALFTPAAPGAIVQNYAEGTAFTVGDRIIFNNAITAATTFRISNTTATNLQVGGLVIGSLFNGNVLNPAGAITIQNGAGAAGAPVANTLTLGAGGIDLSLATQNLTISQDTANGSSLLVTTNANQTWINRTGRTISLAAAPFTLANNLTLQGAGTFTFGGNGTGPISGAGNLQIDGAQSGGASVVNLAGTNTGWTGALTVGIAGTHLRLGGTVNLDQSAAAQNKLADAATLTINNGTVNLLGTGGGTETVGGVALGRGLNLVTRTAGTGILQMNTITRSLGAAVNFGNLATTGTSHITTDNLNTASNQLGGWAVAINGTTDANWVKTAGAGTDIVALALSGADYTTQTNLNSWLANQNILVNAATTASTASRTIGSLKMNTATIASLDIGAGNTLTIDDGSNSGGIIGVGNFTRLIGSSTTVGQGTLTAGLIDDSVNDTLYIYNVQNTTTINMVIADNNTGLGTDTLHLFSGGAGTVVVNANNTFTGGTTIAAGTLNLGANSAATNDADLGTGAIVNHGSLVLDKQAAATLAQLTIANNITGTGALTINRGTATLSGTNDYSGATTVSASTTLRAGSAASISANSRMILNAATATLDLNGFDVSVAALRGDNSTAAVTLGGNTLTLSGSNLANSGSAELLQFVGQNYQGVISGAGGLVKNGLFTQVFTAGGALSYTGTTTVNAGVLQTNKAMATSALTINNSTPSLLGGGSLFISNVANSLTTTTAVNLANVGSTWQINNGFNQSIGSLSGVTDSRVFLQGGAGNITLTVNDNTGGTFTFGGVINAVQGAGVGSVTKEGNHTWVLSGGNSFDGPLTINGGIVQVAAANPVDVIGDLTPVVLADVAGAALDVNSNNVAFGSLAGGGTTGGNVTLGATGRLTLGYNNTSTSFGGVISGGAAAATTLTKLGTGTQTLNGANTFVGSVLIGNLGGQSGGGLTLGTTGLLDDTVAVANRGQGTTFTVNSTDTMGAVTGTLGTTLALGAGATLTSTYTNGTPTALAATADSASANGRIVRNINTAGLKAGDIISGTGVTAPGYIVQIINNDMVLLNTVPPAGPTNDFAPTITSVNVLHSAITGTGGFTKDGTGLLIMTGASTFSGATTVNNGDVQIGGIWTGQKFSLHDALSDSSQIVFSAVNTTNLNFANSATNLLSFERVGSVAGGAGVTTSINLLAGGNVATLAIGGDNSSTTFTGRFLGNNAGTFLLKEGTGTFTWSNPTTDVFDGPVYIDNGGFTIAGATGFDASNEVYMSNRGTTLTVNTTGGDTIPFLHGGAGATRIVTAPVNQPFGGLQGNYLTSGATVLSLTTSLTVNDGTATNVFTFNGDIQGAGTLIKSGTHVFSLTGASTNAHTGETQITAGTLRVGTRSGSNGVGAPGAGSAGTLSTATGLRLTGGVLDLNSTAQTVARINASSTGGTIQLVNGSLTLADQNTQTTATVFTGNFGSVLNLNATAASTLSLTGNSTGFGGTVNVGTNAALTLNRSGGAFNSTALAAARINLAGTGTQLTVTLADTIGSLSGTGDAVLTQTLTLREAASGTSSAAAFTGVTSGAGGLTLSGFGGLTVSGNLAHTGGISLSSNAALNLNYGSGNNIIPTTGALTLGGGTLRVVSTDTTAGILESAASTSLNAGSSSLVALNSVTGQWNSGVDGINLGAITRAAGGTLDVGRNAAATSTANVNGILGGTNSAYATFNQGSTWAVANGAATAITGNSTFNADTFTAGQHTDITAAGLNPGGSAATVRFSGANAATINGATTLGMGGILVTRSVGANTSTISGALDATGNELILHQYNPLGDLLLSNVAGTNTVITTAGGGRTLISSNIAGTGATNIGYGYLQLGDDSFGGSGSGMVGSGAILNNGTLGVNRANNQAIAAIISGTGNVEQLGIGTTTLGGANTFAGRVSVLGGTLEITNNAGLGLAATSPTNRWANLTSVNAGASLLVNVAAGGTITEVLNLDGGTLDLRSTVATTLAGPVVLSSGSTINVSNPGAAVSHVISGDIIAAPGANLTVTNVGGATPSTLVLAPTGATGARWDATTIGPGGRLQVGNNSRGWLGTGAVSNDGELIFNINDGHYVLENTISGTGNFTTGRGTVYMTADNTYTGTTTVGLQSINAGVSLRIGNDTYTGMHGTGNLVVQAVTAGASDLRYHLIADNVITNNITLNANSDGTTARTATLLRQGIGNITLTGNLTIGPTNLPAPGTQRAILQTEGGGKLEFSGTLVGGGPNNLLNIVNNGIFKFGGTASNSYHGVLSGNNVWVFANSGTTTLLGVNTVNSANNYLQRGTLVVGTGGVDTIQNDNDLHVLSGATLSVVGNETMGDVYTQRGGTINLSPGVTLTMDDNVVGGMFGTVAGAGNLTLGVYRAMYGTNTATGTLTLGTGTTAGSIQTANLTAAIGSFTTINLGAAGNTGAANLEYIGPGQTFTNNLNLSGTTAAVRITASGSGGLILSGNITNTGVDNKTLTLSGQTGGYFNPVVNRIDGAITEGANIVTLSMPNTANDDRFGITGRWTLTNSASDYSGGITVNVGMLEFTSLGTGAGATSSMGDLTATRTITLGSDNFDGRRYDMFGSGDQLGAAGFSQGTNTLTPSGNVGTIIFNDPAAGTATFGANISWAQPNITAANTTGGQLINDGTKVIVINGTLTGGTTGNKVWILDGTNTGLNTINGVISNPTTSQTTAIQKEGSGTWRLTGANTFTGAVIVNDGILELSGGAAVADTVTVALNADGGDGLYSGVARVNFLSTETIGLLTGDVGSQADIAAGQTLSIVSSTAGTMSGMVTGSGSLTRTVSAAAQTFTLGNRNSYTGVTTLGATGAATGSLTLQVAHLADGGLNSGIGASTNAAANLVFASTATQGGILTWIGFTDQTTDRLFTMSTGTNAARINAAGQVVGTMAPALTFSNTGALVMSGAGTRTLTLGGATITNNTFRPQITDAGGATSLVKLDAGLWFIDPAAGGNTYTGGTTITAGTLAIDAANALGTGTITINGGAAVGLELRAGMVLTNNITNAVAGGGIRVTSGSTEASGTITITNELRVMTDAGTSLEFSAPGLGASITGAGTLWKLGDGTLTLSGPATARTGATIVSGGTLVLNYGAPGDFDGSKLADAAALTLGWNGTGVAVPGVDDNVPGQNFTRGQSGGTLRFTGVYSDTITDATHTELVSAATIGTGASYITRVDGQNLLQLQNLTRAVGSGGTLDVSSFDSAAYVSTNNFNGTGGILNTTGGGAGTLTGAFATVARTNWAVTAGAGSNISITPLATYAADAYAAGNNTDVVAFTATVGAQTTNTLRFNQAAGGTLTLGGALSLQSSGLLVTPNVTGTTIITGGAIQHVANTANFEALIIHQHGTGDLQIDSVIQNNPTPTVAAQGLTKSGTGKVFLNAVNLQTGAFNLNQGEVQVGGTSAAPTTATPAMLGGTNVAINISEGATLRFLSNNGTVQDLSTIAGGGAIILDTGNTMAVLMDTDNANYHGNITVNQGTLRVGAANGLGSNRGITTIGGLGTLQLDANAAFTSGEFITYQQGATVTTLTTGVAAATLSGKQTLNNTTTAGLTFNIPTSAGPAGTLGLNVSGVMYGTNGFTKTGSGILQISANNFGDVYDGYTALGTNNTRAPTLLGQIQVNAGVLYVGGNRALGAMGVGNETIAAAGASIDLRDADTNFGDDSDLNREIFRVQGTGLGGTGALRNTLGTGTLSFLTLDGDATVNTGGTANASAIAIQAFDTNLSNANALTGAFTRNRPVIVGGGFDLTLQGGRVSSDNLVISDPTFSSAIDQLLIREGSLRFRHEVGGDVLSTSPITAANITGGIDVGYSGTTTGDLTGAVAGTGANVGSRLQFDNYYNITNTVNISMDGALAATATGTPGGPRGLAGGANYLAVDFFTIPDASTFFNGTLTLSGSAIRNVLVSDSIGNFSVVEQGNTTVAPVSRMVIGGVVQGTGGFTKVGFAETRLTANNTFSGDVNVLRFGTSSSPWQSSTVRINGVDYATSGLASGWAEWGLTLNGTAGAMTSVGTITLQRRGMITLDNTQRLDATSGVVGGNNNDRIGNSTTINMEQGWLRVTGGTATNTEVFGTVNVNSGTNILDLYPTDGAGVDIDATITTLNRSSGGVLRLTNLDATSTFSTALTAGENVRVAVGTLGAAQIGGGGAANTTTRSIVQGVFSGTVPLGLDTDLRMLGFNNGNVTDLWNQQRNLQFAAGSHFTTYEGGFLRPLDDDEYFTVPGGVLSSATPANQNVNLSDVLTQVRDNTTINSLRFGVLQDHDGSGGTLHALTTQMNHIDHHALLLNVDGTLTISSGMISSAYWAVGNTSSLSTVILGGQLDFAGQEAIINNQNSLYRLTDAIVTTGNFEIRSAITNADGLTKTGLAQVVFDGANTYSGVTTINDGALFLRNGRTALGAGGAGNGVVVEGNGSLNSGGGIVVGTPTAREDIYIGVLQGDNQIVRTDNDVTVWNSNITIDNVDIAGQTLFTPRIRTDASATAIFNGSIAGGDTPISNDVVQIDSRRVSFDAAGNNVMIFNGVFGDRFDGGGNAVPVADPVSLLPTLPGTRTNENEVLRVNLGGGSIETAFMFNRQYNAAGRLEVERGTMIVNYDPAAPGNDGTGFWTNTALSRIPNADSTTTAFAVNGGTTQQGFVLNDAVGGVADNNGAGGLFLARAGQVFNMASWTMAGTGAKHIGGLNRTGTVTFGNGTGTLTAAGAIPQLYAADGGIVVFSQRIVGNVGTAPSAFGFVKAGLGTVELRNSTAGAGTSDFVLAGGTLLLNHTAATSVALVGNLNARFDGGTLISVASSGANTTDSFATGDAANQVLNFSIGGTEIVARTTNTGTARNMTIAMGNVNANATTSNFLRGLGATANLVEDNTAGGTAQITLQFNASTTAAVKNQVIPWATFGTLSRTATDFAMSDSGAGNDVRAFSRALDEFNNNVASWGANQDVSENGGAGFNGTLGGALTLSTLRFDANADSTVNLGTNVLTVAGNGLASSGGGILVSSNVGSSNKTITGGVGAGLTTSGGRVELIIHNYAAGNFNINVPITGAGVDLVIAGPSTTNASTIGTTGAVVLGATNTYDGQTFVNGSVLSFSSPAQLGTNATATAIVMNGGTLRYTGAGMQSLGTKGIQFDGNGGTIDVADGSGELYLETAIVSNAQYRGDLIKVGAGTLTLNGAEAAVATAGNPGFLGLVDVRQGTLRLAGDHGNNTAGNGSTEFSLILGSSLNYADGTIMRNGTNLAIQMGNANDAGTFTIAEWITFEGNNYVSVGTINTTTGNTNDTATAGVLNPIAFNPNNERPVNLAGVLTLNGAVTFDVVPGQTLQLNGAGVGYTTGNGTLTKDGAGTMTVNTNNPDFTGAIVIKQGRLTAVGQADVLGTGYTVANGSKTITLGDASRQGIAELALTSEGIHGHILEINHPLTVVYNPAQSKRVLFETFANGSQILWNGDVTLNDNLQVYINDAAENGGSQNYVTFNGRFFDGATTSGNLVLTGDDTGGANDNTSGRPYNYLILKNDNSGWTGDVRVNTNTTYDQDQTAILRLEHATALTAANDVDMGFNSILQVGGGPRTVGALSTNGGVGPFIGGVGGGTMGASTNGTTVIIENAATTAGTLTITQSTPASTEVVWNAYFRDGTLNSQFLAPGSGPTASAALNVVKAGSGWATMAVDSGYTGTTTVTGGILQVGRFGVGDTGAVGAGGLTANVGTTIAGTGVIQGNSTINGNLRPGDEAGALRGTLLVNGNLVLGGASISTFQAQRASYTAFNVLEIHDAAYSTWNAGHATDPIYSHLLNDPVTTAQHDQLRVAGSLTVNAGGKVVLANNGYNPTAGDIFNLVDWTGAALGLNVGGTAYNGGVFRTGAETGTDLDLFQLGYGFLYDVSQFNSTGNIIVVQSSAQQYYWNGDQDALWNTNNSGNTNWLNAPAGTDPGSVPFITDDVFLTANSAINLSTTLGQNFSINSLTFTGAGTSNTAGSSIGGNTLTLNAGQGAGITVQTGSGANSISSAVVLAASQTWTNNATNPLTVSGVISGPGSSNLTIAGTGRIIMSNANTYTGTTTINPGATLQLGAGGTTGSLDPTSDITVNGTLRFNRSNTMTQGTDFDGVLNGTGTVVQAGSGTTILNTANGFSGGLEINAGTLSVSADNNMGAASVQPTFTGNGATLAVTTGFTSPRDYALNMPASTDLATINVAASQTLTSTGTITGTGGLVKAGGGLLDLTTTGAGAYDFDGGVTINSGELRVGTGAILDSGMGATGVVVNAGGTLSGSGTIADQLTVNSTGTLSPGAGGPATLSVEGPMIWNGGSNHVFDVNNITGTPGTNWDQLLVTDAINGTLTINATAVTPATIVLNPAMTAITGFDKTTITPYTWLWVTASAGISLTGGDPIASRFVFDDTGVFGVGAPHNPNTNFGTFYVSQVSNQLFINYVAVPEPGSMILLGLAGLGMGAYGWRRRKQGASAQPTAEGEAAPTETATSTESQA